MPLYDYIIAGGGAAGLGLAYQMAMSSLRGKSVLIVEREAKDHNDRTWCFWTDQNTVLDHLIYHPWRQAEFIGPRFQQVYDLDPYQYHMIRGIDYYQGLRQSLNEIPGMQFMQARVSEVSDTSDGEAAQAIINGAPYGAKYAFDSTFKPSDFFKGPARYHYL